MKKYRKFIIPFVMIILIVSMALPSSAAESPYSITFIDLVGYRNSNISAYWKANNGKRYYSSYYWVSDNELRITDAIDDGSDPDNPVQLPLVKDGAGIDIIYTLNDFTVQGGDYIYLNVPRFDVTPVGSDFENLDSYELTYEFVFQDVFGVKHTVTAYKGFATAFYDGNVKSASFTFKYDDYLPATYKYLVGMNIEVWMPEATFTSWRVNFWTDGLEFYIGDPQKGPIYDGPDTSYLDDLKAQEDSLREQTVGGIQDAGNVLGVLSQVIGPGTSAGEGLLGVTALLTPVFEPFLSFLLISLSIGLIMFIIGTVGSIHGSASWARVRDLKANYYKNKSGKGG